jgi:hypothetical protein
MRQAKEIELTWDTALAANLPNNPAFTFMDLLALKGHAPVVVESRPQLTDAVELTVAALAWAGRGIVSALASAIERADTPAYDFMTLLTENGHVPAWVQAATGEASTFGRLVHNWANDDWKVPANNNDVQKVA